MYLNAKPLHKNPLSRVPHKQLSCPLVIHVDLTQTTHHRHTRKASRWDFANIWHCLNTLLCTPVA